MTTKTKKLDKLPHKPSKLIRLAIRDILRAKKNPRMEIDMNTWHSPNGKCRVCFAGAVMHYWLKPPRRKSTKDVLQPSDYSQDDYCALIALNRFRRGNVRGGCEALGTRTEMFFRFVPSAEEDFPGFIKAMRNLAAEFAAEGN